MIEVLPKDKKGKDQTTTPLGQVTVDLLPLLRGETRLNLLVDLHPVPGSPLDAIEAPKVEMEITVQVFISVFLHLSVDFRCSESPMEPISASR